jgi:hypothetical protein
MVPVRPRVWSQGSHGASLAGAILLTGCQSSSGTPKIIVVAASATANEPAPAMAVPDRDDLNAGKTSTHAVAGGDPNTGRRVRCPHPAYSMAVDHGPDRDSELGANVHRVQQLLNTLAASKPFDLLAMIAQAMRVTTHPGTLLVLSSGLSTAGGFDLRQVGWGADPRTAAVSLGRRGLLPRLTGWKVVFSGRGHERDAACPAGFSAAHSPLLAGSVSRGRASPAPPTRSPARTRLREHHSGPRRPVPG